MKYDVYLVNEELELVNEECTKVRKGSINECINYMRRNSNVFNQGFVYHICKAKTKAKTKGLPMVYAIKSSDDLMKFELGVAMFERLS